jgi:glutathione S-transferase
VDRLHQFGNPQKLRPIFHGGSAEDKAKAAGKIKSLLALAAKALTGDCLMGSKFSPPDAYLFVMLLWCEKVRIDLADLPQLGAFKARMKARPGVAKALGEEGL